jgi:SAM-dependent methyltransferase
MIREIIRISVALVLSGYLITQVRKPSRWVGRLFARLMNKSHSDLTDWGLSHVTVGEEFNILDVGCGGGRTVSKLAQMAREGVVNGIDYAAGSVAESQAHNRQFIEDGRVHIEHGSVSKLPFSDDTFDLVTAIETQYYWPNLPEDMREILRVLRPGGKLLIIAENYKGGRLDWLEGPLMKFILRSSRLTPEDQRNLFGGAGYEAVQVAEEVRKGWICVVGVKPNPAA